MSSLWFWTVHILVLAYTVVPTCAIPVDFFVRPSSLSVRAQTANSTVATDFVHSWGPSVLLDWVDHVAYPNTNHSKQELCRKIGLQLEPLTFSGFWKDVGGSAKTIAGVTPWIAEAAVKYSRGEQT